MTDTIIKDKCYSIREAVKFVPVMKSAADMKHFIEEDMKKKNILNTKVIQREKQKRYFILGMDLIKALPYITA